MQSLKSEIESLQKKLHAQSLDNNRGWQIFQERYARMESERYGECFGLECLFKLLEPYFSSAQFSDDYVMKLLGIENLNRDDLIQQHNEEVNTKYTDGNSSHRIWGNAHRSDKTLAKIWWLDNAFKFIEDNKRRKSIEERLQLQAGGQNKLFKDVQARILAL